ncbi:MAG: thioredoxin [Acidobacteriota bacterium]|nr:thioredoxin [Acidobacteriota bacterium]
MANLPKVLDDTFESDVLESDVPVLVDFSASWCGPCKTLAPKLEQLSKEYDGRIKFFNLDVDEARDTAMKFGVLSVPTVMIFKNGQKVASQVGDMPRTKIVAMLDGAVGD